MAGPSMLVLECVTLAIYDVLDLQVQISNSANWLGKIERDAGRRASVPMVVDTCYPANGDC